MLWDLGVFWEMHVLLLFEYLGIAILGKRRTYNIINIGVVSITHVRYNIQGRSSNAAKVIFHTIRNWS